jgi:hypothetical protein
LPNLYIAATRRSALDPELDANLPRYALRAAARRRRRARHPRRGLLVPLGGADRTPRGGHGGGLAVLDADPFSAGAESLLDAGMPLTVVAGTVAQP